jgi:hypothetical protein
MNHSPRRIVLSGLGAASDRDAARILSQSGEVIAVLAEPASPPDVVTLRDAAIRAALDEDFGDVVLAGVAFAPAWGGDAIGFT